MLTFDLPEKADKALSYFLISRTCTKCTTTRSSHTPIPTTVLCSPSGTACWALSAGWTLKKFVTVLIMIFRKKEMRIAAIKETIYQIINRLNYFLWKKSNYCFGCSKYLLHTAPPKRSFICCGKKRRKPDPASKVLDKIPYEQNWTLLMKMAADNNHQPKN